MATDRQIVPDEAAGQRLDRWLQSVSEDLSRSRIQKLINQGFVNVDGRVRGSSHRLRGGEVVEWEIPEAEPSTILPEPKVEFTILYEDAAIAVIDKPAGLVVHPAPGHRSGTLINGLLARLDSLSSVGGTARPGLVHRIDRQTSGLLVVAKTDRAHQSLSEQLRRRELGRVYLALCWGHPRADEGVVDAPLDRHPTDRKRRAVREGGREARTNYWVEERLRGAARLRLSLQTGRTHQIRVHLAHLGHPVLADEMYGGDERRLRGAAPEHREALRAALRALGSRHALHAAELHLKHPDDGRSLDFVSELAEEIQQSERLLQP